MIVCPNCKHKEIDGALFCSECGAQLVFTTDKEEENIEFEKKGQSSSPNSIPEKGSSQGQATTGNSIILKLVGSSQTIPLAGQKEFTLGRITEASQSYRILIFHHMKVMPKACHVYTQPSGSPSVV